jgi:hypothetical protein
MQITSIAAHAIKYYELAKSAITKKVGYKGCEWLISRKYYGSATTKTKD